jgi:hypothetical protein
MAYPAPRRTRRPQPTHIRALEVLAKTGTEGCTEALMLAHGFASQLLVALLREGLAAGTTEHMVVGGRKNVVLVLRITNAGRKALNADDERGGKSARRDE